MNSLSKPAWKRGPVALAAASGIVVLPVASLVAWNVMEQQIQPDAVPIPTANGRLRQVESESVLVEELASIAVQPDGQIVAAPARPRQKSFAPQPQPRAQRLMDSAVQPLAAAPSPTMLAVNPGLQAPPATGERFEKFNDNVVTSTAEQPVSTFSIDVDTASYARVRAAINAGNLLPKDMVRVEEMINYFDYAYPLPETRGQPFKPTATLIQTPWNQHTQLLHIGIKGFDPSVGADAAERPDTNLVFLLDVSGSMSDANKLPLLTKSFKLLLRQLKPSDTVSIVTYAGRSATVLDSVKASDRATIIEALDRLQAGGSTAGAGGIEQAYRLAEKNFIKDGVNRVILATDGDFNVGVSDPDQLKDLISKKRKSGIFLSVFGFGQGNYNDALMQSLAQNGNGQAAYIDSLSEAQKVLVEEAGGSLFTIALDVKIQMEFNPAKIAEYRLIGYETRALQREDFNNDKVDAGEIGAGHTVTALYEITPMGSPAVLNSPLRYGDDTPAPSEASTSEIGFLKLRYKLPGNSTSKLLEQPVLESDMPKAGSVLERDSQFAAAVAAFGQKLRGQPALSDFTYRQIADLAAANRGRDDHGHRTNFTQLVRLTEALAQ
ncbi:MAG: VWA domain-containing protein [Hyphomicrobiales bacterium]|nr:VWA domain-containing protein [Hyphomicrobiales bacterium]